MRTVDFALARKVMRKIMTIALALLPVQDQGGEQHAFCYQL